MLGILQFEERQLDRAEKALKRKKRPNCKTSSPVWDARNAAAATTTPERLEPDPARACPAPTLQNENEGGDFSSAEPDHERSCVRCR